MTDCPPLLPDLLNLVVPPAALVDSNGAVICTNSALDEYIQASQPNSLGLSHLSEIWKGFSPEILTDGRLEVELLNLEQDRSTVSLKVYPPDYILIQFPALESTGGVLQRQRLETLGMLASGVAHDFNNVLAGILGHITYLKTVLPDEGTHSESLVAIEDGAKKASQLTRQILDFSRYEEEDRPTLVDLSSLTGEVSRLLKGSIPSKCKTKLYLPDEDVFILGVEGKIAQILVNLIVNARDACAEEGQITIHIEPECEQEVLWTVFQTRELSASAYAELRVVDNGCGISSEHIGKVFEPYFSTKGADGTGLGLSTVKDVVERIGGAIDIQSEVGTGTAVSVFLPRVVPSASERGEIDARQSESEELEGGGESILVVDDEASVRNVIAMSLDHLGYRVDTASNGLQALEKLSVADAPYDLVILDMLMPELSGEEVHSRMLDMDQAPPVLVISGYSSKEAVDKILDNGGRGFIQKPFTIEELSKKVRACF